MGHRNQLRQLRGGHETPGGCRDPQHLSPRCPVGLGVPQACLAQTPRATTRAPFCDPCSLSTCVEEATTVVKRQTRE